MLSNIPVDILFEDTDKEDYSSVPKGSFQAMGGATNALKGGAVGALVGRGIGIVSAKIAARKKLEEFIRERNLDPNDERDAALIEVEKQRIYRQLKNRWTAIGASIGAGGGGIYGAKQGGQLYDLYHGDKEK